MQVFGLSGHIIRQGRAASRILDAKAPDILVAARHEAVARWRRAMSQGLDAGQGGPRGGPQPGVPVSLAGPARDQEPAPALIAFQNLDQGLGFGR